MKCWTGIWKNRDSDRSARSRCFADDLNGSHGNKAEADGIIMRNEKRREQYPLQESEWK